MVIANQITIISQPGSAKELRTLLNELAAYAISLKGCHKFELYQIEEERHRFIIIEIWKSGRAHHRYLDDPLVKALRAKTAPLIAEESTTALKLTRCLTKQQYWKEEA